MRTLLVSRPATIRESFVMLTVFDVVYLKLTKATTLLDFVM